MHPLVHKGARIAHLKPLAQIKLSPLYISDLRSDNGSNYQHFQGGLVTSACVKAHTPCAQSLCLGLWWYTGLKCRLQHSSHVNTLPHFCVQLKLQIFLGQCKRLYCHFGHMPQWQAVEPLNVKWLFFFSFFFSDSVYSQLIYVLGQEYSGKVDMKHQ